MCVRSFPSRRWNRIQCAASCTKAIGPYYLLNSSTMNSLKKPLLFLLLATFGALFGGCETRRQKDTAIPWSRPAGWEGQIPGMGQQGGR